MWIFKKNQLFYQGLGLFCLMLMIILRPGLTKADATASLYFIPTSGSYQVNSEFSVRLVVQSDASINLTESTINFSTDTLTVTGISKTGSCLSLWFSEPQYSNNDGTIFFSGGIPNPGFTGLGRILTINLKAKAKGAAWLKIRSIS